MSSLLRTNRPRLPVVAAVLALGIGLPLLARLRSEDGWAQAALVLTTLLLVALAMCRASNLQVRQRVVVPARLGTSQVAGARLPGDWSGHVEMAVRDARLSEPQADLLHRTLDAAVQLLAGHEPRADTIVRVDLDRLDGETGAHLRLRLATRASPHPRCERRLRQLCTRLGAQLDIAQEGQQLQVELVLPMSAPLTRPA
ncbi:hypothetical protein ACWA7J_19885 [Leptothrix sp. BB-4]